MKLKVERNGIIGVLKDESGVVRGLWFKDIQRARDPQQLVATVTLLEVRGEKIDEKDRTNLTMYDVGRLSPPVEPLDGGYCVKFLSATRPAARPWWRLW